MFGLFTKVEGNGIFGDVLGNMLLFGLY